MLIVCVLDKDIQMLSGIKAYPDASCNLQMPLTDFCRATITSQRASYWLIGPLSASDWSIQAN